MNAHLAMSEYGSGDGSWARAHANIALIKYWGKVDAVLNLPAVPSISLTLSELTTETYVQPNISLAEDEIEFAVPGNRGEFTARVVTEQERARVVHVLESARSEAGAKGCFARVVTRNNFPTASGLASSSSGFAALVAAARRAYRLSISHELVSRHARRASASAARSVYGGFCELAAGILGDDSLVARPLSIESKGYEVLVATTTTREKTLLSTAGMTQSKTSALYETWLQRSAELFAEAKSALSNHDWKILGQACTESFLLMHSVVMTARPPHFYWLPGSVALLTEVESLRQKNGLPLFATMDAGPHVKVFVASEASERAQAALHRAGALAVLRCTPGTDLEWT